MSSFNVHTITPGTAYKQTTAWNTNGTVSVGPNTVFANGFDFDSVEMQSSVNTPDYALLLRKKQVLPQHPYERLSTKWTNGRMTGYVEFWSTNSSYKAKDTYYGPAHLIVGFNVDDNSYVGEDPTNQAISRLFSEISLSKGSLGVGIAEAGKTASHIAHSAERIAKAALALKNLRFLEFARVLGLTKPHRVQQKLRRNHGSARRQWRTTYTERSAFDKEFFSRTWLEYQYAWRPLVQDAYDQAQNLHTFLHDRQPYLRAAQGSAKTVTKYSEVIQRDALWTNTRYCTTTNRVRIGVFYSASVDAPSAFGLVNPALVAWELVPFSFVADWFLPIGSYLESLTATSGLTFRGGFKSLKRDVRVTGLHEPTYITQVVDAGQANRRRYVGAVTGAYNEKHYKRRDVLTTFPSLNFPSFKDPRSFAHAASAIALLQSVFLGKSSPGLSGRIR